MPDSRLDAESMDASGDLHPVSHPASPSRFPQAGRPLPAGRSAAASRSPQSGRFPHALPAWKRPLDLFLAIPALIILSPLLALVALLVRVQMGAPVIFRQQRPGLGGRLFTLFKFRTMREATDDQGRPLPDGERLTRLGRVLRATSLDELPELINVVRGDMSLVGPRPLLVEYLPLYSAEERRRHEVRPGITGLAQVNGRNALTWRDRFALDVEYVDRMSFLLDVRILMRTLVQVLRREGISHRGHATMEPYRGHDA